MDSYITFIHLLTSSHTHTYPTTTNHTCIIYLCHSFQPSIESVASHTQIRLVEFVFLGPAERGIAKSFLNDGMEPGQKEVEPGSLVRLLAHPRSRDGAEGADEVGFDSWWRLKRKDTRASQEVDWNLRN